MSQFEHVFFSRRLCLAVLCKQDAVHKTGSTQHIATPPEQVRAMVAGNIPYISEILQICVISAVL